MYLSEWWWLKLEEQDSETARDQTAMTSNVHEMCHVTYSQSQCRIQRCTNCTGTAGPLKTVQDKYIMYVDYPEIIFLLIEMTYGC